MEKTERRRRSREIDTNRHDEETCRLLDSRDVFSAQFGCRQERAMCLRRHKSVGCTICDDSFPKTRCDVKTSVDEARLRKYRVPMVRG